MQVMTLEGKKYYSHDLSTVLTSPGGVKGWVKEGTQFTRLMDGYDEKYWEKLFAEEESKVSENNCTSGGK